MMTSGDSLNAIRAALRESEDTSDADFLRRYFKTAPGEYGEGDRFIGVRVPEVRRVARRFRNLSLSKTLVLLKSEIHEERFLALVILTEKFRRGAPDEQSEIYREYLNHTRFINNWDLVDASADRIVGAYLRARSRRPLYGLARSELLWERRIAVMATFHFIKNGEFEETLKIAGMLLADREDLIHKAVGWMLREVGKRDRDLEELFLRERYRRMPRTMLRYAIEKFPENLRQQYLRGAI
ncbi:MAG: DNA alkylation repair protein [Candidatus Erginobacter occultus]|nr:DNA alkylation repair protein [Candidatus Erginobacter occultus]